MCDPTHWKWFKICDTLGRIMGFSAHVHYDGLWWVHANFHKLMYAVNDMNTEHIDIAIAMFLAWERPLPIRLEIAVYF